MPDMENILSEIQKGQEGTNLGLAALAEQLQKMNEHSERQIAKEHYMEEEEKAKEEEEVEKAQYEKTISDVAKQVTKSLKKQLVDLGSDEDKKVSSKTKWPMSGNPDDQDEQTKADVLNNDTEHDAQQAIVAKQDLGLDHMDEEDELGSEEYPMEEDAEPMVEEEVEMGEEYSDNEVRNMARMVKELRKSNKMLQKQMTELQKGQDARIQKEVTTRLQKAGWREENNLRRPQLAGQDTIGASDPMTNISKANPSDASGNELVSQLMQLSWADVADLRERKQAGFTEGLPHEIASLG